MISQMLDNEKFLFFFNSETLTTKCCIFANLRKGVTILGIVGLVFNILGFLHPHLHFFTAILYAFGLVQNGLMLKSAVYQKVNDAKWSYTIYAITIYVACIIVLIYSVFLIYEVPKYRKDTSYFEIFIFVFVNAVLHIVPHMYFAWVIFSYYKFLKFNMTDVTKGVKNELHSNVKEKTNIKLDDIPYEKRIVEGTRDDGTDPRLAHNLVVNEETYSSGN